MDIRKAIKRSVTAGALMIMVVAVQFFVSCGSEDYQKPSTTQTDSALISAATLSAWMNAGKVNGTGYDRVVILDITSYATYSTGHIPGALFVDGAETSQTRNDGVAATTTEVLEGPRMDDLIQRSGIDGNTTIVFTGSSSPNVARAYFTFRYWGFPKNRLKVLDGFNSGWTKVSGPPDTVARSSYTVRNNGVLRDDLRVSLAEMIAYADGNVPNVIPIDLRSSTSDMNSSYLGARGKSGGSFLPGSDSTVFEGRIRGAQAVLYSSLHSGSNVFNPVDQLISTFTALGLDSTKTAYVYCQVGSRGAVGFFVLDGILGWPVALYDGSWAQWGQLSGDSSKKGKLNAASFWRTDLPSRSDLIVYNYEPVISVATFSGTGLDDLAPGNIYTSGTNSTFKVEIDSVGTPDTFRWTSNAGSTWTSNVAITGSAQALVSGLTVSFASTTGHAVSDTWTFTATAKKAIEQLTADPNVCSATYKADGTTTNSYGGNAECASSNAPSSFDADANRIEKADKAYMESSGSGGSTGGGTSVPAGC